MMYEDDYLTEEDQQIIAEYTGGYDPELAAKSIYQCLVGLEKMARVYNEQAEYWLAHPDVFKDIKNFKPDAVSRTINNVSKTICELTRLAAFAQGKPDTRPDLGSGWLQALTKEQFEQVQRWAMENVQFQAEKGPSGD